MSDPERRALALRLFGTGKPGDEPGPLHPGWVQRNLSGTRTTLQRWRKVGIPPDRLDDVMAALRSLMPEHTETAAPSTTRRLLAGVMALEKERGITSDELSAAMMEAEAFERLLAEADARLAARLEQSPRRRPGRAGGQAGGRAGGLPGSTQRKPK